MSLVPTNLTPVDSKYSCGYSYATATIANNASLSDAMDLGFATLVGVVVPATWTAAVISFAVSVDGSTYGPLYDTAGEVVSTTTFAGGEFFAVSAITFLGGRLLKVRSGTNGSAVNQGGARSVLLLVRNLN